MSHANAPPIARRLELASRADGRHERGVQLGAVIAFDVIDQFVQVVVNASLECVP